MPGEPGKKPCFKKVMSFDFSIGHQLRLVVGVKFVSCGDRRAQRKSLSSAWAANVAEPVGRVSSLHVILRYEQSPFASFHHKGPMQSEIGGDIVTYLGYSI